MNLSMSGIKFKEKPQGRINGLVHKSFYQKEVSVEELAIAIGEGYSFCPGVFKNNVRKNKNFIMASMIALDIDESTIPMEKAIENFSCTIAYNTFSNGTKDGRYSYRLLVLLDDNICSIEEYRHYATILSKLLQEESNVRVDKSCLQGSKMYFGTNGEVTTTISDYDYTKKYLTSWWNNNHNTTITYNSVIQETDCDYKHGYIYALLKNGTSDYDIVCAGRDLGYKFISSSKQMIEWEEGEEVRIESNHLELNREWRMDADGKRHPRKWNIGEDRRIRFLKMLSLKKQIYPTISYDELLYNAICERFFFFNNSDGKLNNQWIISILPSVLRTSYIFKTTERFACNMPLLKAKGKSYQKAIAENKHQRLVQGVMTLYNPTFTILQNLDSMKEKGLKICLRTLKNILREQGLTTKRRIEVKQDNSILLKE